MSPTARLVAPVLALAALSLAAPALGGDAGAASTTSAPRSASLPARLERNRGQAPEGWDFLARTRGGHGFVRSDEIVLSLGGRALSLRPVSADGGAARSVAPDCRGFETGGVANYLLGDDAAKWLRGIPLVNGVTYHDAVPGTSWTLAANGERLELTWTLTGMAEPALRIDGATETAVAADGSLRVTTVGGRARLSAPVAWQDGPRGERRAVTARFETAAGGLVRVALGERDPSATTFVDPTIDLYSYIGGTLGESGVLTRVNPSDEILLAGTTTSAGFPVSATAAQSTKGAGKDMFVAKLNSAGTGLVWSSFLGANGDDTCLGLGFDSQGRVVLGGSSNSTNYFCSTGAMSSSNAGGATIGVLTKLDAAGQIYQWSTYVGTKPFTGPFCVAPDDSIYAVADQDLLRVRSDGSGLWFQQRLSPVTVPKDTYSAFRCVVADSSSRAWVFGETSQPNFTVSSGTFQPQISSQEEINPDCVVMGFATNGTPIWSTFLGTRGTEVASGGYVDAQGRVYVFGTSRFGVNFPVTSGAYQEYPGGQFDGFVTRLSADGTTVDASTLVGGIFDETLEAFAVHRTGAVVVGGSSFSYDFQLVDPVETQHGSSTDAWYATFDSDLAVVQVSFLGGSATDRITGAAYQYDGTLYVSGVSDSTDLAVPSSAYQPARSGVADGFFLRFPDMLIGTIDVPNIATTSLPDWTWGLPYSPLQLEIYGGRSPVTFTAEIGLPQGMSLSSAGVLGGTPSSIGPTLLRVRATDSIAMTTTRTLSFRINPAPSISTTSLPDWTRTAPYDRSFAGAGGTGAMTWSISAGTLPPGLTFTSAGRLSGTPTTAGDFAFTVRYADSLGAATTRPVTVRINDLVQFDSVLPAEWTEGRAGGAWFTASGGTPPLLWSWTAGTLPWAFIDSADGTLRGKTKSPGAYDFSLRVSDSIGFQADRTFHIVLNPPPEFDADFLPPAAAGRPYSAAILISGGTDPLTFTLDSDNLPAGLSLDPATGVVSGLPTGVSLGDVTFSATDAAGAPVQQRMKLDVVEVVSLAKRKATTKLALGIGVVPRMVRAVELTAGCVLDVTLTGGGSGKIGPILRIAGADGNSIDPGTAYSHTAKGAKLKKYVVPATGRYFLEALAASGAKGKMTLSISITPPAKFAASPTLVAGDPDTVVPFSAPPGAKLTVTVKLPKGSVAMPSISAITGPGGADVLALGSVKTSGTTLTFTSKTPLAGGDHEVWLATAPGKSGPVSVTISLKLPPKYTFSMEDVPAGDGD